MASDWPTYKKAYDEKLLPFLKANGLAFPRELLGREPDGVTRLTYRQVADRLFASGREMPRRLFTGIGFDYWQLLELALTQPDLHVEALFDGRVKPAKRKALIRGYMRTATARKMMICRFR